MPTGTQELVAAITATWRTIQRRHPELPEVMFTLGEGGASGEKQRLGHFLAGGWMLRESEDRVHEVFVGAEGLAPRNCLARCCTRRRTPWPTSVASRAPAGRAATTTLATATSLARSG